MRTFWLTLARLSASAWVGAAALFVVTALREVRHPEFDSITKDSLALLRFPAYYAFGFVLVALAIVGTLLGGSGPPENRTSQVADIQAGRARWRYRVVSALLGIALLLMVVDSATIYRPIVEMITPPGKAHPPEFRTYHRASIWINCIDVGLCAAAAVLLCRPTHDPPHG